MSKTRTKIVTKAHPKIHAPVRPQTGRSSQTATAGEKQRSVRKALPAAAVPVVAIRASRRPGKQATIEALIRRPEGAAIADLTAATGWQQHSVRAALTGLRKQGYNVIKDPRVAGGSIYRIIPEHKQPQAKA